MHVKLHHSDDLPLERVSVSSCSERQSVGNQICGDLLRSESKEGREKLDGVVDTLRDGEANRVYRIVDTVRYEEADSECGVEASRFDEDGQERGIELDWISGGS